MRRRQRSMAYSLVLCATTLVACTGPSGGAVGATPDTAVSPSAVSSSAVSPTAVSPSAASSSARPTNVVRPAQFGAKGNGRADDTKALQRALDAVRPGGVLELRKGAVYRHTGVLEARVRDETIEGDATLLATKPSTSSFWVDAAGVTVDGPTFRTTNVTKRYVAFQQMGVRIAGVPDVTLENVTVRGSAAAGIYIGQSCCSGRPTGSSDFLVKNVHVTDTRADGIHMTGGANHGRVVGAVVHDSGDDGIAVVSYRNDQAISSHITVTDSTVLGTTGGRGISVVGGDDITYRHITITKSSSAGVYLAQEGSPFYTRSTRDVTLDDVRVSDANVDPAVGQGAVLVYTATRGYGVSGLHLSDVHISGTPSHAPWEVGVHADSGSVRGVVLNDFTISGNRAPLVVNVKSSAYSAHSWTINGDSVPNPHPDD